MVILKINDISVKEIRRCSTNNIFVAYFTLNRLLLCVRFKLIEHLSNRNAQYFPVFRSHPLLSIQQGGSDTETTEIYLFIY